VQVVTAAAFFMIIYAIIHILPSLPGVLSIESRGFRPTPLAWAWILYMALICTVVTFAGQTWAMARMSATTSAIIFSLEPVFATTMALAIGGAGEWPGARGATGAALVMIGVLVSVL
jgi:drug/metabolite transporter (DMT)-like permease